MQFIAYSILIIRNMKGENLKKYRKNKGVNQSELADQLGVSLRTIQNWEKDYTKIPHSVVEVINNYANIAYINEELFLEKDGVKVSENEILIWLHKNLKALKEKEGSIYHLVFKDMVNEKVKETIEEAGFKVEYTKKDS